MTQDLTLHIEGGIVNIRVAAWIEHQDELLICTYPNGIQTLPGGRVKFGESTLQAVMREVQEETNEHFTNPQLIAVIENFFTYDKPFHEFLYVYKGNIPYKETYTTDEQLHWFAKSQASELKPQVITQLLQQDTQQFLHIIHHDK